MASKPETVFREHVRKWLKSLPRSKFFSIQQISITGTPDMIGVVGGWFVAMELKKDKGAKASPLQLYNLARVNSAGGFGLRVYPENWEAVKKFLTALSGVDYDQDPLRAVRKRHADCIASASNDSDPRDR